MKVSTEVGPDSVAVIAIDNPVVNALSSEVLRELAETISAAHERADVRAVVLTGAHGKFSGGADIKSMKKSSKVEDTSELPRLTLMNDIIEGGPKPLVAAVTGFALGGGLELAMACHARIATPGARFGLPELQLGIIPGLGGTQRLPRLVGLQKGIDMILSSRLISSEEAEKLGLVDIVCDKSKLIATARKYALRIANRELPFLRTLEREGKLGPKDEALAIVSHARMQAKKLYPHVDFPFIFLDVVEHGILHGGIQGTILERKLGAETIQTPVAKALMHQFLAERNVYKVPGIAVQPRKVKSVGVVGGGLMGSGIATAFILNGFPVCIKEVDEERLQSAITRVESNCKSRFKKGSLSEQQFRKCMGLLTGTVNYAPFASVDIVIEAAIESIPLKKQIFKDLNSVCSRDCILASNTSSIDLNIITKDIEFPERVLGAHFFSPAHVMKLLEVVRTEKTSKQAIADVISLSKSINKIPVVVKNTPGFAVNRVFFPYIKMAMFLADLGVHPYRIDAVIKEFGMPMGPFRLGDLAGLQIGSLIGDIFKEAFGDRMYISALGSLLVKDNRIGESVGKGYYNYSGNREAKPAPELELYLERSRKLSNLPHAKAESLTDEEIVEMIFFPVVNEACRVIDEGVVIRASDLDIASVLGMGFPKFRGGLVFWAERVGFGYILSKLNRWHFMYGSYFRPTPSLQKLVAMSRSQSRL